MVRVSFVPGEPRRYLAQTSANTVLRIVANILNPLSNDNCLFHVRNTITVPMHQESEFRTKSKQRFSLMLLAMCFGLLAMFGYFGLLAFVRADVIAWANNNFGADSENWIMLPLMIPAVAIFLLPTCVAEHKAKRCLLYTSPSPRDRTRSRMPSSA